MTSFHFWALPILALSGCVARSPVKVPQPVELSSTIPDCWAAVNTGRKASVEFSAPEEITVKRADPSFRAMLTNRSEGLAYVNTRGGGAALPIPGEFEIWVRSQPVMSYDRNLRAHGGLADRADYVALEKGQSAEVEVVLPIEPTSVDSFVVELCFWDQDPDLPQLPKDKILTGPARSKKVKVRVED